MKEDFLLNLDKGQRRAVISLSQYILCLAGAGSGKTRVLTSRIFYLINKLKIKPENILAITFTRSAAREMLYRLLFMRTNVQNLWCRTFHSLCYRILREISDKNFKVIDQAAQDKILKQSITDLQRNKDFAYNLNSFIEENDWTLNLFFEETFKVIKECKSRFISSRDLMRKAEEVRDDETSEFLKLISFIFESYQRKLKEINVFDFSDLMNRTIFLLERKKTLLSYYQRKFKFILVDEFQDVNLSQVKLLELLTGKKNNLFVVGDDWQSIYGFRGGNVKYILDFKKKYQNCESIILPYNYRSDGNIVEAANKVIKRNFRQTRKKIKPFHPSNIKIKLVRVGNNDQKENFVMEVVKKLIAQGIKEKEIMVLGRTWKQVESFLENFPKMGLRNIRVTTIHGAKGQEAEAVFIVGLIKGRRGFPYIKDDYEIMKIFREANKNERLEEERRMFYVAMTRAKKLLFLITEKDNESIFVRELPRKYLKEITID